jgi:glycine/D-amino acid oxidase-like deaminating enzyme
VPAWTGIGAKPIPGDGDPVLGRVDAVAGLSVAFTHSGATLGLIAGELIASEIIHDASHPLLGPFNVRRFG